MPALGDSCLLMRQAWRPFRPGNFGWELDANYRVHAPHLPPCVLLGTSVRHGSCMGAKTPYRIAEPKGLSPSVATSRYCPPTLSGLHWHISQPSAPFTGNSRGGGRAQQVRLWSHLLGAGDLCILRGTQAVCCAVPVLCYPKAAKLGGAKAWHFSLDLFNSLCATDRESADHCYRLAGLHVQHQPEGAMCIRASVRPCRPPCALNAS